MTIGITDSKKYEDYRQWMANAGTGITIQCLSYKLDNLDLVASCNGIILTGGHDVHPALYNKPNYLEVLDAEQIDQERDAFEMNVIASAISMGKPILGICRGLQIANVYFGGTLIVDIPTVIGSGKHGKIDGQDQRHEVSIVSGSLISTITNQETGIINSAHHQSADTIGEGLCATAFSDNNIIEALEYKQPQGKPWLLLVQWHPERISNDESFSLSIRKVFLENCE